MDTKNHRCPSRILKAAPVFRWEVIEKNSPITGLVSYRSILLTMIHLLAWSKASTTKARIKYSKEKPSLNNFHSSLAYMHTCMYAKLFLARKPVL
ncbi:hypothetical protein D3C80_1797770 [compost metagenome]